MVGKIQHYSAPFEVAFMEKLKERTKEKSAKEAITKACEAYFFEVCEHQDKRGDTACP